MQKHLVVGLTPSFCLSLYLYGEPPTPRALSKLVKIPRAAFAPDAASRLHHLLLGDGALLAVNFDMITCTVADSYISAHCKRLG